MSEQRHVVRKLLTVLDQGRRLLERLDPELYTRPPEPIATSTIGEHVRHVLDCCACFVDGLAEKRVDYDRRARDRCLELDPVEALERLRALARRVEDLVQDDPQAALEVRAEVPDDAPPAAFWRSSTVGRELVHVLSHTTHHYALVALVLRHFGVEPEQDFGVAPSTLRYWKETGRCAPLAG